MRASCSSPRPSGLTLGPEGGAHQSINSPLIGMGQPGLTYWEPAFVDELALTMRWAFDHMQAPDGGSVYLRLTTRVIDQIERADDDWQADALRGGYWLRSPAPDAEAAIVFTGAIAPEVLAAWEAWCRTYPGSACSTSPRPICSTASGARPGRTAGPGGPAPQPCRKRLLGALGASAGLVTIIDGSPGALSWLGGVRGMRTSPLGTDRFGQTGDLPDLYRLSARCRRDHRSRRRSLPGG
jgi:pyruvate dehydrogenase E1 component